MIKVEDVDGNDIKLPYGTIELDVEQGGWYAVSNLCKGKQNEH